MHTPLDNGTCARYSPLVSVWPLLILPVLALQICGSVSTCLVEPQPKVAVKFVRDSPLEPGHFNCPAPLHLERRQTFQFSNGTQKRKHQKQVERACLAQAFCLPCLIYFCLDFSLFLIFCFGYCIGLEGLESGVTLRP